jgi:hypothetical protein
MPTQRDSKIHLSSYTAFLGSAHPPILSLNGESMKTLKELPHFKTEAEERKFWETHDSTDYVDWSKAERVRFSNLKPSTTAARDGDIHTA